MLLFFLDPCSPLARLQSLQHEYKLAALRAKHQDDTATATRHLRVAKVGRPTARAYCQGARGGVQAPVLAPLDSQLLLLEPRLLSSAYYQYLSTVEHGLVAPGRGQSSAIELGMGHPLGSWGPSSTHLILSPEL